MPPQRYPHFNPKTCECYLISGPHKTNMIKLMILKQSILSGSTLNAITCIFIGRRQWKNYKKIQRGEDNMQMEQKDIWRCWPQRLQWCGHKPRNARSHQVIKEVRNGFSPRVSGGSQFCPYLIETLWHWFWTFGSQNCEISNFCCFLPSSLWSFFAAATGNIHFHSPFSSATFLFFSALSILVCCCCCSSTELLTVSLCAPWFSGCSRWLTHISSSVQHTDSCAKMHQHFL